MSKLLIASFLVLSTVVPGAQAAASKPSMKPNVSLTQARSIALRTFPGKVVKEELEKEGGGSGWRYSFDIAAHGVTHEVGVDAMNGRVLENSIDTDDKD